MKATAISHKQYCAPYPNAATPRQVMHKILDTLLIAVSGMGLAAIVLFLLAL